MKVNYLCWQKASDLLILGNTCEDFRYDLCFKYLGGGNFVEKICLFWESLLEEKKTLEMTQTLPFVTADQRSSKPLLLNVCLVDSSLAGSLLEMPVFRS